MEHFVAGTTARTAGALVKVNHKTAAYYFHRLREIIDRGTKDETPFAGEVEVDESYFGGRRREDTAEGLLARSPYSGS